jgi:molecular chaperone GrpE
VDEAETPVVVRDRRRIDPDSGEVRGGADQAPGGERADGAGGLSAPGAGADQAELDALRRQVAERTGDLQRLKAEYDNYRRRVERDRQAVSDQAAARVLAALLPTLDDIGRAREHGDLEGPFKAVAESFESTLETAGLERFGSAGEEFDPLVHDALMHAYRSDVSRPTAVEVFRSGYRHAGRVLRPAQVSVAEPELPSEPLDSAPHPPPVSEDPSAAGGSAGSPDDTGSVPHASGGDSVTAD